MHLLVPIQRNLALHNTCIQQHEKSQELYNQIIAKATEYRDPHQKWCNTYTNYLSKEMQYNTRVSKYEQNTVAPLSLP